MQVSPSHYKFETYMTPERWASYYSQLKSVAECNAQSVLYVGVGDNIVPTAIELQGIPVCRFDVDPALKPDLVGDLRKISSVVAPDSHEVVICCQVLEHLPFDNFRSLVRDLADIATKRLVISLPYRHKRFINFKIELPGLGAQHVIAWTPAFWRKWKFDGEHHWEVGTQGYSERRILSEIRHVGRNFKTFHVPTNWYHYFIIIDK